MSRFSLAPYTIRVREKRSNRYIQLGNKKSTNFDLMELLEEYLAKSIPSLPLDPTSTQVIRLENHSRSGRYLSGILRAGEYGYGASLLDVQADTISYERQLMDAELIPYYFLLEIPEKLDVGIAIFQKLGNLGVKDLFNKDFNHFFVNNNDDYILEIDPLIPKDLVKKYLENRIVKIRLISYGLPEDIADCDMDGVPIASEGESEYILKAQRNGKLPEKLISKLKKGIDDFLESGDKPVGSIIELKEFKADNLKVEVRIGNSYRTVDLSNSERLRFSEDISGRVIIDPTTGHPTFDSINTLAQAFLNDCALAIWGGNSNA